MVFVCNQSPNRCRTSCRTRKLFEGERPSTSSRQNQSSPGMNLLKKLFRKPDEHLQIKQLVNVN